MKTPHSNMKLILTFLIVLILNLISYSQPPSLAILKNNKMVTLEDMSISKNDIITVKIINSNRHILYRISNLYLEVRTIQYQQIKTMEQAKKYHKVETKSSGSFEISPKIEIKVSDYAKKYVSRIIVKLILVEQQKDSILNKVDWITYGKEYEFWYY